MSLGKIDETNKDLIAASLGNTNRPAQGPQTFSQANQGSGTQIPRAGVPGKSQRQITDLSQARNGALEARQGPEESSSEETPTQTPSDALEVKEDRSALVLGLRNEIERLENQVTALEAANAALVKSLQQMEIGGLTREEVLRLAQNQDADDNSIVVVPKVDRICTVGYKTVGNGKGKNGTQVPNRIEFKAGKPQRISRDVFNAVVNSGLFAGFEANSQIVGVHSHKFGKA